MSSTMLRGCGSSRKLYDFDSSQSNVNYQLIHDNRYDSVTMLHA